jgi:hypothetical protein
MTPVIAMPACAPPTAGSPALPALPALSALLQQARRMPDALDWRGGVLSALDLQDAGRHVALVAAHAVRAIQPGMGVCMAMPVHVVAGMSRVFLGAPEAFALDVQEREHLRLAFNAEFGTADLNLHAVGSGWLLQAPFAAAANDGSPESLFGIALAREPAASAAGRSLRRLGVEVEMWLTGLAFNAARENRGEAPINCIWMWGGATARGARPPGRMPGALFTNEPDAWMTGLAAHCGLELQQALSWEQVRDTRGAVVILQPPSHGAVLPHLPAWESAWFEPARRDLASKRLASLRLQIGHSAWQLPAPRLTRWMRRRRPWSQMVWP